MWHQKKSGRKEKSAKYKKVEIDPEKHVACMFILLSNFSTGLEFACCLQSIVVSRYNKNRFSILLEYYILLISY